MASPDLAVSIAARATRLDTELRPQIRETPLLKWRSASDGGAAIGLKLENEQVTGSFKARGALARVRAAAAAGARKVIASSTGNHVRAVAHAARLEGVEASIYVPTSAEASKVAAITSLGADVREVEGDPVEAELAARSVSLSTGVPYVSPYNDPEVIAGQATVACELVRQTAPVDEVFVAVGGGGLISGIASVLRTAWPACSVVGAYPERSPAMERSVRAGSVVPVATMPTLSDGTAGGIEPGAITVGLCASLVDRWVAVTEDDIAAAIARLHREEGQRVEGAAAVAAHAAAVSATGNAIVIICGGNIDPALLARIVG